MNQKSVIILFLIGIVAVFLAVFALGEPSQTAEFGEPVTMEEEIAPTQEVEDMNQNKPQAKINIQAVCESSLMYTSFTDGAAADAYVAECVEGKHPDVIQRYIDEMGLDGAMI